MGRAYMALRSDGRLTQTRFGGFFFARVFAPDPTVWGFFFRLHFCAWHVRDSLTGAEPIKAEPTTNYVR